MAWGYEWTKLKMNKNNDISPLSEDEIRDCIQRVLKGDRSAFAPLVVTFQDQIFAMILGQTGDSVLTAELAQETFVRAYRYLGTFKGTSSFKTWLIRIALNRVKSYFSSSAYRKNLNTVRFSTSEHEISAQDRETEDTLHNEQVSTSLHYEISQLKDRYREVLVLKVYEGLSYLEIADTLNIPIGTVSSRMNKALRTLKSRLKEC
jgi:RNA polymerase sigma-70 factor, ECF subfamily